ncbi:MAG: OmpA family protein [Pseudomonadota bacterium]
MKKTLACLFSILFHIAPVHAEYYVTPILESRWSLDKSDTQCRLTHRIPAYGSADFLIRSGKPLHFFLREERGHTTILRASLVVENPEWLHLPIDVRVFQVYKENTPRRLAVYGDVAEVMLDALSGGLSPTFIYTSTLSGTGTVDIKVAVSPVKFMEAYENFLECRRGFPPASNKARAHGVTFDTDALCEINFANGKSPLTGTADIKGAVSPLNFTEASGDLQECARDFPAAPHKALAHGEVFDTDALREIYFANGKSALDRTSKEKLDVVARFLSNPKWEGRLEISGHADSTGNRRRNQRLSLERAQAVKEYLAGKGVDPKRMLIHAFGEKKPAVRNRRAGGHERNRRVRIDMVSGV